MVPNYTRQNAPNLTVGASNRLGLGGLLANRETNPRRRVPRLLPPSSGGRTNTTRILLQTCNTIVPFYRPEGVNRPVASPNMQTQTAPTLWYQPTTGSARRYIGPPVDFVCCATPFVGGSSTPSATPICGRFAGTALARTSTTTNGSFPTIACSAAAGTTTSTWSNPIGPASSYSRRWASPFSMWRLPESSRIVRKTSTTKFKRYFVQPWRREAPVHYKGTVYGAPRNASINYVFYPKYSDRLKSHSLYLEARLSGRKVLERAGITCVSDLLYFNFNDYWERKLVLRKVDLD